MKKKEGIGFMDDKTELGIVLNLSERKANQIAFKSYQKRYKKAKKQFMKACKAFQPFDYYYNFNVFLESLRLTLILWENPDCLFQDTSDDELFGNKYSEAFAALREAVEIGDRLNTAGMLNLEEEDECYNRFWDIMKKYFRYWWD